MKVISLLIIGIILALASYQDYKEQQIYDTIIIFLGVVCLLTQGLIMKNSMIDLICSGTIGLFFLGLSILSKEQIGVGDGLIILCLGIALGMRRILWVVSIASVLLGVVSLILLVCHKIHRADRIAFVPFLLGGYVLCFALV